MSWMDSWSRPAKSQATPAPYYLLPGGGATPYCHSCGRVIGQRKQQQDKEKAEVVKYCSSRCRGRKPGKLDREIEGVFLRFLLGKEKEKEKEEVKVDVDAEGEDGTAAEKPKQGSWNTKGTKHQHKTKKVKGDARILVSCSMVEDEVFPHHDDLGDDGSEAEVDEDGHDRPGSSSSHDQDEEDRAASSSQQYHHPDPDLLHDPASYTDDLRPLSHQTPHPNEIVDGDVLARMSVRSGTRIRPPQSVSEVNGSVGGEKGRAERTDESEEALRKRIAGQRRAREREMVRCAARRGVAFGFAVDGAEDVHHNDEQEGGSSSKAKKGGKKSSKKHHDGEGGTKGETKENRRLCEAVMAGKVVEPSFAKGDWSIRWREE